MNLKSLIIPIAAGLCISAATSVKGDITQYLTFTITTFTQGSTNDNGTNTVIAPPKVKTHNTAELLSLLARDKNAQGLWDSNSFPAGAKLAVGGQSGFRVVSGTNFLISVSDILSFTNGEFEIISGKAKDSTELASPTTNSLKVARIMFDDMDIQGGGGLRFYLQGILSQSTTDTAPVNGTYTETRTAKITNAVGEGTDSDGNDFVCTGTVTATGRGLRTLQQ